MKLQLMRLGAEIELAPDFVATFQIESRHVFARVVSALLSEQGEDAEEPYLLWGDDQKAFSPKKALMVLNQLPNAPLDDRVILGKLYDHVAEKVAQDNEIEDALVALQGELRECVARAGMGMWGTYDFALNWGLPQFLKAFGYRPRNAEDGSLLEKCIAFFELCTDIGFDKPLVLVNAKSFFTEEEVQTLISQAIFCGIRLLLLESWHDDAIYKNERKTTIDQDLLVF